MIMRMIHHTSSWMNWKTFLMRPTCLSHRSIRWSVCSSVWRLRRWIGWIRFAIQFYWWWYNSYLRISLWILSRPVFWLILIDFAVAGVSWSWGSRRSIRKFLSSSLTKPSTSRSSWPLATGQTFFAWHWELQTGLESIKQVGRRSCFE